MVPVPTVPGVGPRVYSGGAQFRQLAELAQNANEITAMSFAARSRRADPGGAESFRVPADGMPQRAESAVMYSLGANALANYAATARAQAVEVGEVFQYRPDSPVTIERQRSAMIPIIPTPIPGRPVRILHRADGPNQPTPAGEPRPHRPVGGHPLHRSRAGRRGSTPLRCDGNARGRLAGQETGVSNLASRLVPAMADCV